MTGTVYIDITELLRNPIRTGIQRVERELIRHWPGPSRLCPVIADSTGFQLLSEHALPALLGGAAIPEQQSDSLPSLFLPLQPDLTTLRLVNPELFFDPQRAALYSNLIRQGARGIGWLLYDFLPWLTPQDFAPGSARLGMHYLRALRDIPQIAHISEQTRNDYERRIMRGRGRSGPVIPLGGDGLAIPRQEFTPARRRYVALGTIEPRKNVAAILEAFAQLWREGNNAELVVVGMMREGTEREADWLGRLSDEPKFRYLGHADDAELRDVLQGARALVFASRSEGFGLPPLEALHAGIPVIASAGIPSLMMLPPSGQLRLRDVSAIAIADAVRELENDQVAAALWREAASLSIRTWRDAARDFAAWAQDMPVSAR
jgi:glycosyltransferase involved in cell wall biosynthesis